MANAKAKVVVTYRATYFVDRKPVVLACSDAKTFEDAVEDLKRRFPERPVYLSSTVRTT